GTRAGSASTAQPASPDNGLRPGHSYTYRVVAQSWLRRSEPAQATTVTTIAPSPTRLTSRTTTANSTALHWSPPPDSPAPDTYEIHRDGGVIQTVDSTTTSYADRTLSPAT